MLNYINYIRGNTCSVFHISTEMAYILDFYVFCASHSHAHTRSKAELEKFDVYRNDERGNCVCVCRFVWDSMCSCFVLTRNLHFSFLLRCDEQKYMKQMNALHGIVVMSFFLLHLSTFVEWLAVSTSSGENGRS